MRQLLLGLSVLALCSYAHAQDPTLTQAPLPAAASNTTAVPEAAAAPTPVSSVDSGFAPAALPATALVAPDLSTAPVAAIPPINPDALQNDRAANDNMDYRFNIDAKNKNQASFKDWMAAQGIRIAGGAAKPEGEAATSPDPAVAVNATTSTGLSATTASLPISTPVANSKQDAIAPPAPAKSAALIPVSAETVSSERGN